VGGFTDRQMRAHLACLRSDDDVQPRVCLMTWREVHGLFSAMLPDLTGTSALLAEQFIEFLEFSERSGFTGFRREHFDYFLSRNDDDARRWVRAQMKDFAGRVQADLHGIAPFYESHDVGTLGRDTDQCWVAFGPGNTAYRKFAHQTFSLGSSGLRIFINVELKAATDRLKAALKESASAIRTELQRLHAFEPFELVLEERLQERASKYTCTPKMRLHSSLLADEAIGGMAWMAFTETCQRLPLPYLHIDRLIPPSTLLQLPKDGGIAAVELVLESLRRNHAVVELLNA